MKKILSSLIALSAIAGLAPSASANIANGPQSGNVNFPFNIPNACDLTVTSGTLTTGPAVSLPTTLSSAAPGSIETTCNTAGAILTVEQEAIPVYYNASGVPSAAGTQAVTSKFKLTGVSGVYSGLAGTTLAPALPSGFSSVSYTTTTLDHNNGQALSKLNVDAELTAPSNQVLAGGSYLVRLKATLTP
jgi:hypothetical protein